jgi:hypothetical protein
LALEVVSHNDCVRHLSAGGSPTDKASSSSSKGSRLLDCAAMVASPPLVEINLIGLTLGNAWTDAKLDNMGNVGGCLT